jgi:hypothetical protein
MKKLIFLILVVGIASTANAMTLDLVMGDADTVDIDCTDGYIVGDDTYWALVGDTSEITFSGGSVVTGVAPADTAVFGDDAQANGLCSAPLDGVWGFIGDIAGNPTGPGTYIDEIDWVLVSGVTHAEVYLIGIQDLEPFTLDTITVPEPMTLALLGLGGLLVLRRRR